MFFSCPYIFDDVCSCFSGHVTSNLFIEAQLIFCTRDCAEAAKFVLANSASMVVFL